MIFNTLVEDADMEWVMIDSTIVRAHQYGAGAKGGRSRNRPGKSCGGFITKIHAVCDSHGNPLRFILTSGERHDCRQAIDLLKELQVEYVLSDRGYDSNETVESIERSGAKSVIPPGKKTISNSANMIRKSIKNEI